MPEISQDSAALMTTGDLDKLDKHQKEEFHAMQERATQYLMQQSNHFQVQFPTCRIEWKFQMEVYQSLTEGSSTVRYSNRLF
jgi:hypothetical protein